jgi:hypothetical protein
MHALLTDRALTEEDRTVAAGPRRLWQTQQPLPLCMPLVTQACGCMHTYTVVLLCRRSISQIKLLGETSPGFAPWLAQKQEELAEQERVERERFEKERARLEQERQARERAEQERSVVFFVGSQPSVQLDLSPASSNARTFAHACPRRTCLLTARSPSLYDVTLPPKATADSVARGRAGDVGTKAA